MDNYTEDQMGEVTPKRRALTGGWWNSGHRYMKNAYRGQWKNGHRYMKSAYRGRWKSGHRYMRVLTGGGGRVDTGT